METHLPLVVIAGRTNVGKSTLFNHFSQKRIAIVDATPGVTRDFLENMVRIGKRTIRLVDTGGLEMTPSFLNPLQKTVEERVWQLMKEANLVLFVIDGRSFLTQIEWEVTQRLRKENSSVCLVVNKREGMTQEALPQEFFALGIPNIFQVSAKHGDGMSSLKQFIEQSLEGHPLSHELSRETISVTIVGKPNVGKSTLYNTLLRKERAIVSDIPGTTRDAIRSVITTPYGRYTVCDTAGLIHRQAIKERVNFYASLRTQESLLQAEICILLLDPLQGITRQDQRIAREIVTLKKCCLIFINKFDLVATRTPQIEAHSLTRYARQELNFLSYASFLVGSAQEAKIREDILVTLAGIFTRYHQRMGNDFLDKVVKPKINYHFPKPLIRGIVQEGVAPPTFIVYTTYGKEKREDYYTQVVDKTLRQVTDWEGVPFEIRFHRAR